MCEGLLDIFTCKVYSIYLSIYLQYPLVLKQSLYVNNILQPYIIFSNSGYRHSNHTHKYHASFLFLVFGLHSTQGASILGPLVPFPKYL